MVGADGAGLAGVAVALSGSQTAAAVTDASGRYVFNNVLSAGTHAVTPRAAGLSFTPASATFVRPAWNRSAVFVTSAAANAADSSRFFVAQHYDDFLGREPDAPGLQFWTSEIESCGADAACREVKRINVSAAFFLSIEFQETGYLVYRLYESSFNRRPTFAEFLPDLLRVDRNVIVGQGNWQAQLEANKQAYAEEFVARPAFLAQYPTTLTAEQFVDRLNANTDTSLTQAERDAVVTNLRSNPSSTQLRAAALRAVAEDRDYQNREFRPAFVLMQYFGYMRRDPDEAGFQFWLGKLNQFNGDYVAAEMVKAFITSGEYRARFGQP